MLCEAWWQGQSCTGMAELSAHQGGGPNLTTAPCSEMRLPAESASDRPELRALCQRVTSRLPLAGHRAGVLASRFDSECSLNAAWPNKDPMNGWARTPKCDDFDIDPWGRYLSSTSFANASKTHWLRPRGASSKLLAVRPAACLLSLPLLLLLSSWATLRCDRKQRPKKTQPVQVLGAAQRAELPEVDKVRCPGRLACERRGGRRGGRGGGGGSGRRALAPNQDDRFPTAPSETHSHLALMLLQLSLRWGACSARPNCCPPAAACIFDLSPPGPKTGTTSFTVISGC